MPDGLLKTKFFPPPPRQNQVTRKSLLDKFIQVRQQGIQCVLVSAPAGFGKTTLVVDCARANGQPFAWLALDEGDNDLLRFWRYVDAALATIDSRIGKELRPALYAAQTPAFQQIITGLVNDIIGLEKELLLVLDDYHVIGLPEIHDSLNYLLDHLPPQMCLVITTRSDPPLNLARRRGRGQIFEFRAADLRFTPGETAALLNETMQLGLTDGDIASLSQRTEGWIAGLQMAALSMQDDTDPHHFIAAFSGDDHHIADYLVEEVLQRQLVEVQRFLLQTSILDRLNALLCDAVTGRQDSRVMLNTLERANLFIMPLDNRREWFRYHHLFAELLRQRLRETYSVEAIASLHRAALNWYESQGDVAAAIRHARAIPDNIAMLRCLERNAGIFFTTGELPQLFELASLLPAPLRKESPFLCIAVAWAGLAANRYTDVPTWLASIEAHFGVPAESALGTALGDAPGDALGDAALDINLRAALLEVLVIRLQLPATRPADAQRAHILAIREQVNALPPGQVCLLNTALNLKPVMTFSLGQHAEIMGDLSLAARSFAESITWCRQTNNSYLFYLANAHLANIQVTMGQLHTAYQTYAQALDEASAPGQPLSPFVALLHIGLGALQFEWNDLDAASRHFNDGLAYVRLWNLWEARLPLAFGMAWLKQRAGETQAAIDILNNLGSQPLPGIDLPVRAYAALLGGPASAAAWLAANPAASGLEPEPANEFLLITVARLLASARQPEEAIALLQKVIHFAKNAGRVHPLIHARVALAIIAGQPGVLLEALSLAEPEGYLSTFLMEGEPLAIQLQHVLKQPRLAQPGLDLRIEAYGRKILAGFEPVPRKPIQSSELVEPLSERELEVLRYIAEGLTNSEIAKRLYLSPNTLKAHTQNIFEKLDVHNRLQAVSRAKELGLFA